MNLSKQHWLMETNEYKLIAWEYRSGITIDGVPLEEAITFEVDLFIDAARWLPNADYAALQNIRRANLPPITIPDNPPEINPFVTEGGETNMPFIEINTAHNQWTIPEEEVAASFPSGYYVPDNITGGMQEITIGAPERTNEMVSINDLRLYYSGTVNYADGKICRIIGANNKGMICSPLEGGKAFITKDLKPINDSVTGFVNTPVGCIRCFRKPTRTAKEGINTESIETGSAIPWDSYPNEFMDMLNNIYPTEEEAIKIARKEHINVAVSKFKYYDWITEKFVNILKKSNKERVRYELD